MTLGEIQVIMIMTIWAVAKKLVENAKQDVILRRPKLLLLYARINANHHDEGSAASASLIMPRLATLYLTTNGKLFSKYISIWLHKFVHLMK